jgi:hypothetical protein
MQVMGLKAIYRRPRTSTPAPGHRIYPHLLSGMDITSPNQVWAAWSGQAVPTFTVLLHPPTGCYDFFMLPPLFCADEPLTKIYFGSAQTLHTQRGKPLKVCFA